MIVVSVKLVSAVDRSRDRELARMIICNTGEDIDGGTRNNYTAATFRGRSTDDLNKMVIQKSGKIFNWPSAQFHVWNLVAKALATMNYDKGSNT